MIGFLKQKCSVFYDLFFRKFISIVYRLLFSLSTNTWLGGLQPIPRNMKRQINFGYVGWNSHCEAEKSFVKFIQHGGDDAMLKPAKGNYRLKD